VILIQHTTFVRKSTLAIAYLFGFCLLFSFGCENRATVQKQLSPSPQEVPVRNDLLGIWWSPDLPQSAAFEIKDSTIYYPDMFAEYKYEVKGESLLVYRDDGVAGSVIVSVSSDTLVLLTMEIRQVLTRSETQQP